MDIVQDLKINPDTSDDGLTWVGESVMQAGKLRPPVVGDESPGQCSSGLSMGSHQQSVGR